MLDRVLAIRFDRPMTSGKTQPCILTCSGRDDKELELVVKFAAGCDMGVRSLMAEALAALLAADLDLPVPEPFLVRVDANFADTIPDEPSRERARRSLGWNFGSKKLPNGFATYPKGQPLPPLLLPLAAEILAFDTFIVNPDRTVDNPNLLFNGESLAIYDHELALLVDGLIEWQAPWEPSGIDLRKNLTPGHRHVFLEQLRGKPLDFNRLATAFRRVSSGRLQEYLTALPQEWAGDGSVPNKMLGYIASLTAHVDEAIDELVGALK